MININDKDGGLCIEITGNKIKNSFIVSQIVEELAKSDDMLASSIIFGISRVKDKEFIMECVEKTGKAEGKTDKRFASEDANDLNDLLKAIEQIMAIGEDEDE